MFDRIGRSWCLLKEAWAVLKQDRALVLFPILAGIASVLVTASFIIPMLLLIPWASMAHTSGSGGYSSESGAHFGPLHYVATFLYYLISYFVVVFFNTGLVACVRTRFAGGTPTVHEGLQFAASNVWRIFQWSLLSATVGTILKAIQERAGWIGRIIIGLIGLAWSLATMFVVPVLVYEGVGPIEAVKRSAAAFKRTWGETVVANAGISTAFSLLGLGGFALMLAGIIGGAMMISTSAALGLTLIIGSGVGFLMFIIGLAIVQSALQGIFLTACYEYATTGQVPSAFTADYVVGAWRPKGSR